MAGLLIVIGMAVLGLLTWAGVRFRRGAIRRSQVARVRLTLDGRVTVAELRARCGADKLARYPSPAEFVVKSAA